MHINLCGINLAHDKTFLIHRPNGSGDNLFIYTRTPIIIYHEGQMKRYPAETAVFFRKGLPQHFMASGKIYADDFVHFDATEEEMAFIDSLGIPSGTPFTNLDTSYFMSIHRYICIEYQSQSNHKQESINLLLRYFLIKLSQAIETELTLRIDHNVKRSILELRSEIYADVSKDYSISYLASRVGLSESYFQSVYKKMFSRSCINDIIHARVERAEALLRATDHPISTIARMCGYSSDSHFTRQFKKLNQVSPSEYRNQRSLLH